MIKIAIAGQPNCGKSTIFTMMSGVKQYVANYPGVTIEKKSTVLHHQGQAIELVDLPGTYSFSAFSAEEQAAISFLVDENPDIIINVIDASNFQRSLYLSYQLLETGKPVIVVLNMMDVVKRRGIKIDVEGLAKALNVQVVEAVGAKHIGKKEILEAISNLSSLINRESTDEVSTSKNYMLPYPRLEDSIASLEECISSQMESSMTSRWFALKLLEGNTLVRTKIIGAVPTLKQALDELEKDIVKKNTEMNFVSTIAAIRHEAAGKLQDELVQMPEKKSTSITAYIDKVVLNRWLSFVVLALVIYGTYELSIVKGYELTNYTWPYLAQLKNFIVSFLPTAQLTEVPLITEFVVWLVNSALALLNYIPIFLILFAIIAILEDTGYMPRIAFVLDRVFNRYGLHGQSTLPLVLGGAFVGGCAVPGIMATKGIADERARIATIMTVPYMNCLAKVPFYTLLLGAFFADSMSLMMFFISTVTFFIALSVARVLTLSVLKNQETKPFMMELPPYHVPTIKSVTIRAFQRVWMYVSKVGTIVMAVAVVLFVLLQFPGLSDESQAKFDQQVETILADYNASLSESPYFNEVSNKETIYDLVNLYNQFRSERMVAASSADKVKALEARFEQKYPDFFKFIKPSSPDERLVNRAIRQLSQKTLLIQNEMKNDRIENSLIGSFSRFLEPVTQWAGFDWRINVAFLSSFAARESAVATIGSIYEQGMTEQRPEDAFSSEEVGYTALHAVSMLIFMIFTPPCIASMVVLKLNVQSYRLMILAICMPFALAFGFAAIFFTLATTFAWDGVYTMAYFYVTLIVITLLLGFFKSPPAFSRSKELEGDYIYKS